MRRNSNHSENQMKGGYNMNNIKNSKRGLSAIVTTLIIILLVFIAIGIVWAVIQDVIKGGTESIDYQSQCLTIGVKLTKIDCSGDFNCDFTILRESGDDFSGVKISVPAKDETAVFVLTHKFSSLPDVLASESTGALAVLNNTPVDTTKTTIRPYFVDGVGNEILC